MELIKDKWNKDDILEFQKYLKSFEDNTRLEWSKNLIRTELPILCLKTPVIKDIISKISKGNYLSFLDHMVWDYYENTAINGYLIVKIKDFDVMRKYLDIYSSRCDNWATCDLLSFDIKGNEEKFFNLSLEYVKSDKPFVRRIGLSILFNFINDDYIDSVLDILNKFENEEHYYVNMMNAWLLCECFIKEREKTLKFLEKNKLNKFTINKGVQKCRESHRVSLEDRDMLLKFKVK